MALCVILGGQVTALAITAFTLSWTHSVEKTRWEEDWHVTPAGLELVEARIEGSGAGMDPPDGARLENGRWSWAPDLPPQPALLLARSGTTGEAWSLCSKEGCMDIGAQADTPAELRPCDTGEE